MHYADTVIFFFCLNISLRFSCVLSAGQLYISRSTMWMSLHQCFERHSTMLLWQKGRFMTASCKSKPQIRTVPHSTVKSATTRSPPLTQLSLSIEMVSINENIYIQHWYLSYYMLVRIKYYKTCIILTGFCWA